MADKSGKDSGAAAKKSSRLASARAARRQRELEDPLEVRVTLAFRFGDQPEDRIVMLDDVPIPMVGSIFRYRDRMVRSFSMLMLRAGLSQPKVVAELMPAARLLQRGRKTSGAPSSSGAGKAGRGGKAGGSGAGGGKGRRSR